MKLQDLLGENYKEGMTIDEITQALEIVNLPQADTSDAAQKLKELLDKANGEAADYKRKLNAKLTEEELTKQVQEQAMKDLQESHDSLLRKTSISEHRAKLLALGYEDSLAGDTAEALVSGDTDKVFANQKILLENREKALRAEILKATPRPQGGFETVDKPITQPVRQADDITNLYK